MERHWYKLTEDKMAKTKSIFNQDVGSIWNVVMQDQYRPIYTTCGHTCLSLCDMDRPMGQRVNNSNRGREVIDIVDMVYFSAFDIRLIRMANNFVMQSFDVTQSPSDDKSVHSSPNRFITLHFLNTGDWKEVDYFEDNLWVISGIYDDVPSSIAELRYGLAAARLFWEWYELFPGKRIPIENSVKEFNQVYQDEKPTLQLPKSIPTQKDELNPTKHLLCSDMLFHCLRDLTQAVGEWMCFLAHDPEEILPEEQAQQSIIHSTIKEQLIHSIESIVYELLSFIGLKEDEPFLNRDVQRAWSLYEALFFKLSPLQQFDQLDMLLRFENSYRTSVKQQRLLCSDGKHLQNEPNKVLEKLLSARYHLYMYLGEDNVWPESIMTVIELSIMILPFKLLCDKYIKILCSDSRKSHYKSFIYSQQSNSSKVAVRKIREILKAEKCVPSNWRPPNGRVRNIIAGSYFEGCNSCSWFCKRGDCGADCDIMMEMTFVSPKANSIISEYPGEEAYCHIKAKEWGDLSPNERKQIEDLMTDDGYVDPVKFRKMSHTHFNFGDIDTLNEICQKLTTHFMLPTGTFDIALGDVATTKRTLCAFDPPICITSYDEVPCIRLDFWPKIASNWITRKVKWPVTKQRKEIAAQGCHLVPKSPRCGKQDAWRYSFSVPEQELMKHLSEGQKISYYLFKTICYKHIIMPLKYKESVFHSYLCKTVMFWFCEEHTASDPLWEDTNLYKSVSHLFAKLGKYLKQQFLPHFFIPEYNLIKDMPSGYVLAAQLFAESASMDISGVIPPNEDFLYVLDILRRKEPFPIDILVSFSYSSVGIINKLK